MSNTARESLIHQVRENSPLFAALSSESLSQLLDMGRTTKVPAGQLLFRKGDEPDRFFVIVTGSAKASTPSTDGRSLVVRLLGPGDIFGEIAVLDGGARTADVATSKPCELLIFERARFKRYLLDHPEMGIELLGVLARRLRLTTELLVDNVFLGVQVRLARVLIGLARSQSDISPRESQITIELSQQEIAEMAGTSRVSINKQLREWEKLGLLEIKRRRLTILDIEGLEDCVEVCL
jgi:CRP/FNR family cyclic AMP-dependent transcriptional regulator